MKYKSIALALCLCATGTGTVLAAQDEVIMRRPLPGIDRPQGETQNPVDPNPTDPTDPGDPTDPENPNDPDPDPDPNDPPSGSDTIDVDTLFVAVGSCQGDTITVECNRVELELVPPPAWQSWAPPFREYNLTGTGTLSQCANQGQHPTGPFILDEARDEIPLANGSFHVAPGQVNTINGAQCADHVGTEINANVIYCETDGNHLCYREGLISRGGLTFFNDDVTEELDASECVQSASYAQQTGYDLILDYTGGEAANPQGVSICETALNPPQEGFYVDSGFCDTRITENLDGSTTIEDYYDWFCEEILDYDQESGTYNTRTVSDSLCADAQQTPEQRQWIADFFGPSEGYNDPEDVDPDSCVREIGGSPGDKRIEVEESGDVVSGGTVLTRYGFFPGGNTPECNTANWQNGTNPACPVWYTLVEEVVEYSFFCHSYGFSIFEPNIEADPDDQNAILTNQAFVANWNSSECSAQLNTIRQQRASEIPSDPDCNTLSGNFDGQCDTTVTTTSGSLPNEGKLQIRRRYLGEFSGPVWDEISCNEDGNPPVVRGYTLNSCGPSGGIE